MGELNIDVLCANSPQAKGRVERVHQTLQDRLVKELRLRGISTIDEANSFAPEFMVDYDKRFGRPPLSEHDAHRPLLTSECLEDIFQLRNQRRLSRNLTLNYGGVLYVIEATPGANTARGTRVDVYEAQDGTISIRSGSTELPAHAFHKSGLPRQQGAVVPNKLLAGVLERIKHDQLSQTQTELDQARTLRQRQLLDKRIQHAREA
jgi:hypothetical protein